MKERVHFWKPDCFDEKEGVLLGTKCKSCGRLFFPPSSLCLKCFGEEIEPARLSRRGKLYSYYISYMPTLHIEPPYAYGWIELPEGIITGALIDGWEESKSLEIGMDMELVIAKLWEENGKEIIGFKFRPIS